MVVISLINGSMISETTAIYAIKYAHELGYAFELVHIQSDDSLLEVEQSVQNIQKLASSYTQSCEFTLLKDIDEFKEHIEKKDIDMLFCSTRHKHTIRDSSFVKLLVSKKIPVDLAVVKVVKIGAAQSVDKIILPIRGSKLSVKKFTLFSTFSLLFDAKAEIYSIDKVTKNNALKSDVIKQKKHLKELIFNLRHYLRLVRLFNMRFALKHDLAFVESNVAQTHIADGEYDLAIIGAQNEKSFFSAHPIDILFEKPMINVIYFIPYGD